MNKTQSHIIEDLRQYTFIRYIKRHKWFFLSREIIEYGSLFIPVNKSINYHLGYKSIKNHIFKQVDSIHFENPYKKRITVIGNDIRTESGFSEKRLLNVMKVITFSIEDAETLLGIHHHSRLPQTIKTFRVFVISCPLINGIPVPLSDEEISDIQATMILQVISNLTHLTPIIDGLKEVIEKNDVLLSIHSPHSKTLSPENQKRYEQLLRSQGRVIFSACKTEVKLLCSKNPLLGNESKLVLYSIHHFMMQLISPYLTTNISSNCKFDMIQFEQSWKLMQHLTMEDMHISPSFRFSFTEPLKQFNETYFQFQNHPELVMPLTILSSWNRLLCDIRYAINTQIQNQHVFSDDQLKTIAVSTDDLIGIVSFIFLHTDLCLSVPAHLILVDAFCPFDLSISSSGYSYSVIETAVMWINDYAKSHYPDAFL